MVGVPNKRAQTDTLDLLNRFETLYLTRADKDGRCSKSNGYGSVVALG